MKIRNKIALITGAGRGIGKELSIQLAEKDYHVLLVGKTLSSLEEVNEIIKKKEKNSTIVKLDLEDFEGIDRPGFEVHKKFKKIDVLILNAGILGTLGPLTHQDINEFNRVINTNLISNFRLIRSLEPLLKNTSHSKVLFISSGAAHGQRAFWGAYSISKAALEQMAIIWSAENKKSNIQINIVNPGATRTNMRAQAMPGENPQTIPSSKITAEPSSTITLKTY